MKSILPQRWRNHIYVLKTCFAYSSHVSDPQSSPKGEVTPEQSELQSRQDAGREQPSRAIPVHSVQMLSQVLQLVTEYPSWAHWPMLSSLP